MTGRLLPRSPGVYRFRDGHGRVLYVGRAVDLRRRVASYQGDLRDRPHLRRMVPRIARVEALGCDSEHEAAWLERNLLHHRLPPWNRTRGEEVPVHLRVDTRPRTPGVDVVHEVRPEPGVHHFGPYLGGARARLAVSALARALPLAHAGAGLRGGAADLAQALGVDAGRREALAGAVVAVLGRDPVAVAALRAELAARRDVAAGALAYERAATLQAELEAVDWVVSPQRVTSAHDRTHDVHGWSDGVLLVLEVQQGRLCAWTERACSWPQARARVEASAPDWADFADRNARLAAALRTTSGVAAP